MTKHETELLITKYDLLFEQRLTRTETICENLEKDMKEIRGDMKEIRSSMRWHTGIMLTVYFTMFAMMAHGFHWY